MENVICHEDIDLELLPVENTSSSCEVSSMNKLMDFLEDLQSEELRFHLIKLKDSIAVEVPTRHERWEVRFSYEGKVEIEKFVSCGRMYDESGFNALFTSIR